MSITVHRVCLIIVIAFVLISCGHNGKSTSTRSGSPTTPTSPTAPPPSPEPTPEACVYAVAADPDDFDRSGQNGKLTIGTSAGCKWTITRDTTWLTVEGPTQGEGPATLKLSAGPNEDAPERRETLGVADKSIVISQAGQGDCSYEVSPRNVVLPRPGRTADISVTTAAGCRWTASTDAPWIHLGTTAVSGSGRVSYGTDANPGTGRDGFRSTQIKIRWQAPTAGQNVFITQGGTCSLVASRASGAGSQTGDTLTVGAAGGSIHLFVFTDPVFNCPWSVVTNDPWLTVDFPRSGAGSGDGDIDFSVAPNSSAQPRQGVLDLGEFLLKVVQTAR